MSTERWRTTHLHPLYQVSDHGNVRRLWITDTKCSARPLKPYMGRGDRPKVQLGGGGPRVYVHKLVAHAFLEAPPRVLGWHVDHIDFDRLNNHVSNLRWLPTIVNSVRWESRRPGGGNVWAETKYDEQPDDHVPMTEGEFRDYDPAADGW